MLKTLKTLVADEDCSAVMVALLNAYICCVGTGMHSSETDLSFPQCVAK